MAFSDTASLLFRIKGDSSDAVRAFRETQAAETELTSSTVAVGSAFADLAGPVAIIGAAFLGVASAATALAAGLFNVAERASEMGSEIHDAAEKTGLAAETMSALKLAADQGGTSLEAVTRGFRFFTLQLAEANAGSTKAQDALKKLGVTSNDLETALGQALRRVAELPAGMAQNEAAAAAFGRRLGGELIPFINQFHGDLPGLIAEAKRLGATMSQENVDAADAFGDSLASLRAQASATAVHFASGFMPAMTRAMADVSAAFANNQAVVEAWGRAVGTAIDTADQTFRGLAAALRGQTGNAILNWFGQATAAALRFFAAVESTHPASVLGRLLRGNAPDRPLDPGFAGSVSPLLSVLTPPTVPTVTGGGRVPRGGGENQAERERREQERAAREAEQRERERIATLRSDLQDELELKKASYDFALARQKADLEEGTISEQQATETRQRFARELLAFRVELLNRELAGVKGSAEEEKRVYHDLAIANLAISTEAEKQREEKAKAFNDQLDEQIKRWEKVTKSIQEARTATEEYLDSLATAPGLNTNDKGGTGADGGLGIDFGGDILAGLADQFDLVKIFNIEDNKAVFKDYGEFIRDVWTDVTDTVVGGIAQMVDGLGQMLVAWIATGEGSAKAALQMLAQVALSIAVQALIKGIFETAEAAAAAARFDFVSAGLHSAAASIYFTVAAIAGAAGVGLAVAARFAPGGKKGGSGSSAFAGASGSNTGQQQNINQNPDPYSRASGTAYDSGTRPGSFVVAALDRNTEATEKLHAKIDSMRPGDVVTRGLKDNPGLAADTVHKDIQRDSNKGRIIGRAMGFS